MAVPAGPPSAGPPPTGPPPAGPGPGFAGAASYPPLGAAPRRNLLWLWVALAVVLVVVLGTATTLAVVRPWDDTSAGSDDRGDDDRSADASEDPSAGSGDGTEAADGPVTGDIDGDGRGDAVGIQVDENDFRSFTLTSTGTGFTVEVEDVDDIEDQLWADWDGDGDLEGVTWTTEDSDRLNLETDDAAMPPASYDGFGLVGDVNFLILDSGDFDGDGDLDIVAYGQTGRREVTLWVLPNDGSGTFGSPETWAVLADATLGSVTLFPADYDDDGTDDVLARVPAEPIKGEYYAGSYAVQLLTSTGTTFTVGAEGPPLTFDDTELPGGDVLPGPGVLVEGDFRGDGSTTLAGLSVTSAGVELRLLEYDGRTLVPDDTWTRSLAGESDGYISSAVASDVDGDGIDDLVYVHRGDDQRQPLDGFRVVLSDGSGFAESEEWAAAPDCATKYCFLYFQSTAG